MNSLSSQLIHFLTITSLQMFVLGSLVLLLTRFIKIKERSSLWMARIVFLIPLLYPMGSMISLPKSIDLPISIPAVTSRVNQQVIIPQSDMPITATPEKGGMLPLPLMEEYQPITSTAPQNQTLDSIENRFAPSAISNEIVKMETPKQWLPAISWKSVLIVLWVVGVFFLLIRTILAVQKHKRIVRSSELCTDKDILQTLNQCANSLKLKRTPLIAVTNKRCIPFITGFIKPRIILPSHMLERQYREGLRFTILHELAHYKRNDSWWLILETFVVLAYFFHPIVLILRKQIEERREALCDLEVIEATNQRSQYADFLLNQVWNANRLSPSAYAIPIVGKTSSIGKRIKEILEETKATLYTRIFSAVSIAVIAALLVPLLSLAASKTTEITQEESEENTVQPDKPTYVERGRNPSYLIYSLKQNADLFPKKIQEDLLPNVQGVALDDDTGEPLSGVMLTILRSSETWEITEDYIHTDYTTGEGEYTLAPPHSGSYKMVALKEGYAPHYFTVKAPTALLGTTGNLFFKDPPSPTKIRMTKSKTSIRASVFLDGEPFENEIISFAYYQNGIRQPLLKTPVEGKKGVFILWGANPGDGQIVCRMHDYTNKFRSNPTPITVISEKQENINVDVYSEIWYQVTLRPANITKIDRFEIKIPSDYQIEKGALCFYRHENNQFMMALPARNIPVSFKAPGYKRVDFDPYKLAEMNENEDIRKQNFGKFELDLEPETNEKESSISGVLVGDMAPFPDNIREYCVEKPTPLDLKKGLFHLIPRFRKLHYVVMSTDHRPDNNIDVHILKEGTEYKFEPYTHQIQINVPFNPDIQRLQVQGKVATPWVWKSPYPIVPGSVQVFITSPVPLDMLQEQYKVMGMDLLIPDYAKFAVLTNPNQYLIRPINSKLISQASGTIQGVTVETVIEKEKEPQLLPIEDIVKKIPSIKKCMVITDRVALNGYDYKVDEEEGTIAFLREENCLPHVKHYIRYSYYNNPDDRRETKVGLMGGYSDQSILEGKITGLTPYTIVGNDSTIHQKAIKLPPSLALEPKMLSLEADPTHDASVYTLSYVIESNPICVFVVSRDDRKAVKELLKDEDYEYDPNKSLIVLLKPNLVDRNKQILEVQGIPTYNAFVFQNLKPGDPLTVSVEDRVLQRGDDFTVDYNTGRVQINEATPITRDTRYRIDAGEKTLLSRSYIRYGEPNN